MTIKPKLLLVEDDPGSSFGLSPELEAVGYEVQLARRGDEGLSRATAEPFDVVLTDLGIPGLAGLDLVGQLHHAKPKLPIILLTAAGSPEVAIEAVKLGVHDYLVKPFDVQELLDMVGNAVADTQGAPAPAPVGQLQPSPASMAGRSRAMQQLYKDIGRAAATTMTVLVRGETGTGKELVAKAVAGHSRRGGQAFFPINCTAIPETLLESELFGYERGAFTGAHSRRLGWLERADQGTIFLDEIGDLNLSMQIKLLRVLEDKCIQRVGGHERIPVDVRVVAATHRDLEAAIRERLFREDLFYRLSTLTIWIPPLNERLEDIPELVDYFLWRYAPEVCVAAPSVQPEAIAFLQAQAWPGNVRELENVTRRALLLARDQPISVAHVTRAYFSARGPTAKADVTISGYLTDLLRKAQHGQATDLRNRMFEEMDRELISRAYRSAAGNQAQTARWLGITRTTLREKLLQFGLYRADGREPGMDASLTTTGIPSPCL